MQQRRMSYVKFLAELCVPRPPPVEPPPLAAIVCLARRPFVPCASDVQMRNDARRYNYRLIEAPLIFDTLCAAPAHSARSCGDAATRRAGRLMAGRARAAVGVYPRAGRLTG